MTNASQPTTSAETQSKKPKALFEQLRFPAFMPFFWLGIATVAGSFLAQTLKLKIKFWLIAMAFSLALFILQIIRNRRKKGKRKISPFLIIATICLSATLYTHSLPKGSPQDIAYYNDKGTINLTGLVVKPPRQTRNTLELTVRVESLNALQMEQSVQAPRGLVLVELPLGSAYQYGDRISVYGELSQPPEGHSFSYRDYLFHKGVYSMSQYASVRRLSSGHGNFVLRALYKLRERSSQVLQNNFPNPESALLRGILLGDESGISAELASHYSSTGTSHIIAISGFNMAVLAGVVSAILRRRMGRLRGGIIAIGVLGLYTLFVGGAPTVTRAFVMSAFAIFGSSIARRGNLLNSLGLSVFIMVLINPHLPWDIGFQFSVMATLALSLFATPLQAWVEERLEKRLTEERAKSIASFLSEFFLITLLAQILVLPLIIYHFRQVSWLFLIANPLILWAQPLVMILGLIALIGGLFSVALGRFLSFLSWPFVAYTNMVVSGLGHLAPKVWHLHNFSPLWLVVYYALVFLIAFRPKLKTTGKPIWQPAFALIALASLSVVLAVHLSGKPDGKLSLRVFGKTDQLVVLLRVPNGDYLLSGGAGDSASMVERISKSLPVFNQKLAYLLVPACKKADLQGFYGLPEQMNIGQVLWACDPESTRPAQTLYSYFEAKALSQVLLNEDFLLDWGDGKLAMELDDERLNGLSISQDAFFAVIDYAPEARFEFSDDIAVWIGGNAKTKACAELILTTSDDSIEDQSHCASDFVRVSERDWVQISTDGKQVWVKEH